jgi:hypothetical protein
MAIKSNGEELMPESDVKLTKEDLNQSFSCDLEFEVTDQMFTHQDPHSKKMVHYNSSGLYRYIEKNPSVVERVNVGFSRAQIENIVTNRGIEKYRLFRLTPEELEHPILMFIMRDGTYLTADGHHRIVRRWMKGQSYTPAYMIPRKIWKKSVIRVKDPVMKKNLASTEFLKSWSGIE